MKEHIWMEKNQEDRPKLWKKLQTKVKTGLKKW